MGLQSLKRFVTYMIVAIVIITEEAASVASSRNEAVQRDAGSKRNRSVFSTSSSQKTTIGMSGHMTNFKGPLIESSNTDTPSLSARWSWLKSIFPLLPLPAIGLWPPPTLIWQSKTETRTSVSGLLAKGVSTTPALSHTSSAVSRFAARIARTSRAPATRNAGMASSLKRTAITESAGDTTTSESNHDVSSSPKSTIGMSGRMTNFKGPLIESANTDTPPLSARWSWLKSIFPPLPTLPPLPAISWWPRVTLIWQSETETRTSASGQLAKGVSTTPALSHTSSAVSRFAADITRASRAPATRNAGMASSLKRTAVTESAGDVATRVSGQSFATSSPLLEYQLGPLSALLVTFGAFAFIGLSVVVGMTKGSYLARYSLRRACLAQYLEKRGWRGDTMV